MSFLAPDKVEEYIEEYKRLQAAYQELTEIVKEALEELLEQTNIQYLAIQNRAKEIGSLREKLQDQNKPAPKNSVTEMSDLAGCRVILYRDYEINIVLARILEVFEISKYEQKYRRENYTAHHVDIILRNQFGLFPNMPLEHQGKCEIQITTALYHSWSASAHDSIYKPSKKILQTVRPNFDEIKNDMEKRAEETKSIQFSLDGIFNRWNALQAAMETLAIKNMKRVSQINENELIYGEICNLNNCMIKYENLYPHQNYIKHIKKIMNKSSFNTKNIHSNSLKSHLNNKSAYLDVLNTLAKQGREIKEVIDELIVLSQDQDTSISKEALCILSRLLTYKINNNGNITNMEVFIYLMRRIIPNLMDDVNTNLHLILFICGNFLTAEADLVETDSMVYLSKSAIKQIRLIRKYSISTLLKIFNLTCSSCHKVNIIKNLEPSIIFGSSILISMDYEKDITENTNTIFEFYLSKIEEIEYAGLLLIDNQINSIKHHYPDINSELIENPSSSIKDNLGYQIYKALLRSSEIETEGVEQNDVIEYIQNMRQDNLRVYVDVLNYVSNQFSSEVKLKLHAEHPYLLTFLEKIYFYKSELAKQLISADKKYKLKWFYPEILSGIWRGGDKDYVNSLIEKWISENNHIEQCIETLKLTDNISKSNISQIYENGKKSNNLLALQHLLHAITKVYDGSPMLKSVAVDCMRCLSNRQYYSWLRKFDQIHYMNKSLYNDLERSDWLDILSCFSLPLKLEELFHHNGYVLLLLSQKYPDLFIRVFKDRADRKHDPYIQINTRYYEIVPSLHSNYSIINKRAVSKNSTALIEEFFKMLEKQPFDSLRYVQILIFLFPKFIQELEEPIIHNIASGRNINFILELITQYNGVESTHEVCKHLIKRYPDNRPLESKLIRALCGKSFHGRHRVISDSYKRRIESIQSWNNDESETVRKFSKTCIEFLEGSLPAEEKRADRWEQHMYGELSNQSNSDSEKKEE